MADKRVCPSCGAELASGAPMGLCEACLLKVGLGQQETESQSETPSQAIASSQPSTPPLSTSDQASTIVLSRPLTLKPGDRIGCYRLLEQIGEGGCGVVYVADQEQ